MMYKNFMAIVANNLTFIEYMMQNIDCEAYKDVHFCLFNDTRISDKTKELDEIMSKFDVKYSIFTDKFVTKKFLECTNCTPRAEKLLKDYSMSLKFLSWWFIFKFNKSAKKVVLSDDDCVYKPDFVEIFNENKMMSQKCIFGSSGIYKFSEVLIEILGYDVDYDYFVDYMKKNKINSGMFLFVKSCFDLGYYENLICELLDSDVFHKTWYNPRRKSPFIDSLDEVVLTAWLYKNDGFKFDDINTNWNYQLMCNPSKLLDNSLIKNFNRKASTHFCVGKYKYEMYNRFIKLGLIKGELKDVVVKDKVSMYV